MIDCHCRFEVKSANRKAIHDALGVLKIGVGVGAYLVTTMGTCKDAGAYPTHPHAIKAFVYPPGSP